MHVLLQYYNDPLPARQAEYDFCLRRNLDNPHVTEVHNLIESATTVPADLAAHPKLKTVPTSHRLTYHAAFAYADIHLPGRTVALINLDVFLDPTSDWPQTDAATAQGMVFCLSRHEYDPAGGPPIVDPGLARWASANSQDAWVFRPPLSVPDCDFELGRLGCDNAIAHRFKSADLIPVNAPRRFRVLHYDRARGKTADSAAAFHGAPATDRPESRGHYLLPDIDQPQSLDALLATLQVPPLDRYRLVCDLLSRYTRV